jgi:membrane protein
MTATRDPVTRRGRVRAAAVRRALRNGSTQPLRAAEAVKEVARPVARQRYVSVLRRTVAKAWDDRILGLSAEAAFWQLLSLAPLFLALLGSIGYLSGFLGDGTVDDIEQSLLDAFGRAFTPNVVNEIVAPTVDEVLRKGRADVVSVGFLLGLWAGSSATATFVNTVTIAYGMRELRGAVRSRLLALWLYLLTVVIGVVLLPVMVLGPGRLVDLFPESLRGDVETLIQAAYWPIVALLLLVGLVTFYHLAPPRRLPWTRGVPGAIFAGLIFVGGSYGLRMYINLVVDQGFSYGTLAAPIGALLFFYILALAVLLGAELNATIEQGRAARLAAPVGPAEEPARPTGPAAGHPRAPAAAAERPGWAVDPEPAGHAEPEPRPTGDPEPAPSPTPAEAGPTAPGPTAPGPTGSAQAAPEQAGSAPAGEGRPAGGARRADRAED